MTSWEYAGRKVTSAAVLALVAALVLAGNARATSYSPSDAFYWSLPSGAAAGIAVSPDGNSVYVANSSLKRIEQFDSDGVLLRYWAARKAWQAPSSVTTDGFGNVYVLYPQPLGGAPAAIVKYTANGKVLTSWTVPFAGSIAASRGGIVYVLTDFLNAVGVYNSDGQSIGGFVADLPGQWFPARPGDDEYGGTFLSPQSGYDPPSKTVAKEIAVDPSGHPIVAGVSYQALSNPEPDCSDPDGFYHLDTHPYPDPLASGEAVRFTPGGTPIAYGWLSESQQSCIAGFHQQSPGVNFAYGWQSDATNPRAVAVDPNTGEVYSVSDEDLGVIHLDQSLENTDINVNAPSYFCSSVTCSARDWDLLAGNPPGGVAVDCRSNLYMLGAGGAGGLIAKFINQDSVPPGTCTTLNRFSFAPPPSLAVFNFHVGKIGKGTVLVGCSGRPCTGTLSLKSSSPLCRVCTLSGARHFRIAPGLQRTLSLQLTRLGRRLLRTDPGLPITITGRVKGGRAFTHHETLREPSSLDLACGFPASPGGAASISGTLVPADGGERIAIDYLPPESAGLLLPAVQRTVLTNRAGRFHDRYALQDAGKWIIAVTWAGDRAHEPASPQPCSGTVRQIPTRITLTCPTGSSASAPTPFSGELSGAPAGALVALDYIEPPGADVGHSVTVGSGGEFSDSFSPTGPGLWLALAQYKGDAGHAPAEAVCQFTVSPDDFSIAVTPAAGSVAPGASVDATINTAVTSGAAQAVSLSASGGPGAVTFSPASVTAGGSATVSFTAPATAAPGKYAITVVGAGPWASHPTAYTLTVLEPSNLTLGCTPDPNRRFISCTGRLTSGGAGIGAAPVKLTYQPPPGGGSPTVDTATTAADGSYTDTLNAPVGSLLLSGSWQVQARFAGDGTHAPASTSAAVTVP